MSDQGPWRILVVDDEEGVHGITRMIFRGYRFEGRPVELISAHSGAEARALLRSEPDICLALLDVVMESDDEGLRLISFIREELGNREMRIILRTGHPGFAPETEVIVRYDINDYLSKADLSASRLITSVVVALRSWRDIQRARGNAPAAAEQRASDTGLRERLEPLLAESARQLGRLGQLALSPAARDLVADLVSLERRMELALPLPATEPARLADTDPLALLERCVGELMPWARQQSRLIDYRVGERLPAGVRIDPQQTARIWQLLLARALMVPAQADILLTLDQSDGLLRLELLCEGPEEAAADSLQGWWPAALETLERGCSLLGGRFERLVERGARLSLAATVRCDG